MRLRMLAGSLVAVILSAALTAQTAPSPATTPAPSVGASASAPTAFTLSPEKRQKAIAYARSRYALHFASFAWSVLVLVALIAWRAGPRLRDRAEGARPRFWQAAIFVPLLLVAQAVLELPPALYGHRLALRYEQSVQGWGSWFGDWAKGLAVGLVVAIPLVWLLYAMLRKSPRLWWLWFWLALLPILVFLIFVTPLAIEPLFFRFTPLSPGHPELARKIEEVTVRAGRRSPQDKMFEMDASSKYRSINAYVSGLGASKRVVVWDTTLAKAKIPQTLFVFGHEMGHYVLLHIPRGIAFFWALLFVLLGPSALLLGRLLERPGGRWGISAGFPTGRPCPSCCS